MVTLVELDEEFGIDDEKVQKMADFKGSEGGLYPMPHIGDSRTFTIVSDPYMVENDKLPQGKSNFVRVMDSAIEYDLPLSKTTWMGIRKEMVKHDLKDIKGRSFTIVGKEWKEAADIYGEGKCTCDKCNGKVKTYAIAYRGAGVKSTSASEVETANL